MVLDIEKYPEFVPWCIKGKKKKKNWVPESKDLLVKKRARNFLVFILYINAFGIFLLLNSFTAHLLNFIVNPEFSYPV